MQKALEHKSAIVTGANQGLGFEIAKAYLVAGASVMLCARTAPLLDTAKNELSAFVQPGRTLLAMKANVANAAEVQAVVDAAHAAFGQIDILVNNAGVYGPKGPSESVDWQEWTEAIEINLYGSVLMCRAVVPHMKAQGAGKIVQISGGGATNPLPGISAYAVSKAAVIRFMETLAEELRADRIDVNAIAPGALNTRMLDEVLEAGPEKVGAAFYERSLQQKKSGGTALAKGASLAVFLGSTASDGITGKLLSAVWDPWDALPDHREELATSDIYTLRRITPKDRGKTWGNDQ